MLRLNNAIFKKLLSLEKKDICANSKLTKLETFIL